MNQRTRAIFNAIKRIPNLDPEDTKVQQRSSLNIALAYAQGSHRRELIDAEVAPIFEELRRKK